MAIEEKSTSITDEKWKEIENNAIANLHLELAYYNEGDLGYSHKPVQG